MRELWLAYRFGRNILKLSRLKSIRASLRGDLIAVTNSSGTYPITVATTGVVYANSKNLRYMNAMGIWLQLASPGSLGTPNVKIQMEQSYTVPVTQGSSDSNWVIPDGVADIYNNLNDTLAHIKTLAPVPMGHYRIKLTGLGANPSDTTFTAFIFIQELIA